MWLPLAQGFASTDASSIGANGTGAVGPFMFETVGNFNVGRDPFTDPQRKTVITVIALAQRRFRLPPTALNFHHEFASTDCPGSSMRKDDIIWAVTELHASPDLLTESAGAALPGADPLSPEALEADLSPEESAAAGPFDLSEALMELELAARVGHVGEDETLLEEDKHEDIPEEE